MDELPYKLKVKLAMQIHKDIYIHIKLLWGKPESFIAWIGPLLRPMITYEQEYVFKEGDPIKEGNAFSLIEF